MEGRTKVTKDILAEEGRFILANVLAEGRFSRQSRFDDIRRICESAVTLPFGEYVGFLEDSGYLRRNSDTESLEVTQRGARVANGDGLADFADTAVGYFRKRRKGKKLDSPIAVVGTEAGAVSAPGQVIDSRYEKVATIGSGGVGTVYRARQVPLDREVALKEIRELFDVFNEAQREEIVGRFTDVVRAAGRLAHPNILPMHDVNLDREFPYVVSELAPNGSARRLISDAEDFPSALAIKYLLQALHALRAAHTQRVFHRGLKPENMLIDEFGNLKISDFGFQRIVERDQSVVRQMYVGVGSVAYMAPELFTDPVSAGPQSDIYALGIVFYELLTRKLPGRRSPMPSDFDVKIPAGIDDIFDKMTRDSRSERYATIDDILEDFHKVSGLSDVLDAQTQVAVAENPLDQIKFRAPVAETPLDDGDEDGDEDTAEPKDSDGDEPPASGRKSKKGSKSSRRPYSFQQRNKKKS